MRKYFGTDGIRRIANTELTPELVYKVAKAGAYLLSTYFGIASKYVTGDAITVYALNAYNMGDSAYYVSCFSQGILDREYSSSIINIRNRLKVNGRI